jgi:hypothetical protein
MLELFGPNKVKETEGLEKNYVMESLMICTAYQILFRDQFKETELVRWSEHVARVWEKGSGYKV